MFLCAESRDITEQIPPLFTPVNGVESQPNREDTSNVEICSRAPSFHEKRAKTTVDIKVEGSEICISGCHVVLIGSNTEVLKVQSCNRCSKSCYSSSDEETDNSVMLNIQEVEADSYAHDDVFKQLQKILKTSRATKEEAYNTYEMAATATTDEGFKDIVNVKMAALLLDSCANAVRTVTDRFPCKEDVIKAKITLTWLNPE
ncbi:hypothetical protein OS493_026523 [Desmophyllum pertusum]|uniref:Uncharacterized protein n=1 Tax=Desmophyllum pertusum TaxID=174260 RepID=A0A9W9YL67_9CNID|nr:hypothetical protein OS493_026523 [Desmophyllum pertusum]